MKYKYLACDQQAHQEMR